MAATSAQQSGRLMVVSGPSGVGKSTLCRAAVERLDRVAISLSATTRPQAAGEVDGQDYIFLTREVFEERLAAGAFIEHAEVFGNYYGTPKDNVDQALASGQSLILEIDVQGGLQVKKIYPEATLVFILPPESGTLEERLQGRGRDSAESTEKRLSEADHEIAVARKHYDYLIINDTLEQAITELLQVIQGQAAPSR